MVVVTGGAGFIGSGLIWGLNARGITDILVVDDVDHDEKRHNLEPLHYTELMGIQAFRERVKRDSVGPNIEAVFHMGACSSTRETNWDYLLDRNVNYSKELLAWTAAKGIRFIYASSAATYGDGSRGYSDNHELFDSLRPLNLYGKSKLDVDIWARDQGYLRHAVGLRYFNVFGPNEFHKGDMRSLIAKKCAEANESGSIELFKSYRPEYADGEQERDFIYLKDAVAMTLFFLDATEASGVFNIGSGKAESWNSLVHAMGSALGREIAIRYTDMPEDMRAHYQYFTQANLGKLRSAGWEGEGTSFKDAIGDYLKNYLLPHQHLSQDPSHELAGASDNR